MRPKRSNAAATEDPIWSARLTSRARARTRSGAAATRSSSDSARRAVATTRSPRSSAAVAMLRPNPDELPVMNQTREVSFEVMPRRYAPRTGRPVCPPPAGYPGAIAMATLGYALSCEEHGPRELVRTARLAEETGFEFALISDHFHPWIDRQGESPFVWSVLGAIAGATERLKVGTGVTCPTIRIPPAIVAQAAATTAVMMPGRFFLGVGTGENLNEHVHGDRWPPT